MHYNSGLGNNDFRGCGTWMDYNPKIIADQEYFYTVNYQLFFKVMACDLNYWSCDTNGIPLDFS